MQVCFILSGGHNITLTQLDHLKDYCATFQSIFPHLRLLTRPFEPAARVRAAADTLLQSAHQVPKRLHVTSAEQTQTYYKGDWY